MGSTPQIQQKQIDAKNLYFNTALTNIEIANSVGVTNQTIGEWAIKFNWKKEKKYINGQKQLADKMKGLQINYILGGFQDFMKLKHPNLIAQIDILINDYKKQLKG
ncbi:MAG: hypothetical protein M3O71_02505 [Bacteroidota bacterium]|nr:hypothetical protein [Bacteroidota bacterium]